jgi:hypothetical protein
MAVVHVGWATLDRRVKEFSASDNAKMTIEEFQAASRAADELNAELLAQLVRCFPHPL